MPSSKDLTTRVQASTAAQAENPTVAQLIERMKPELARVLPNHLDPDRLARIALTVFRQTPALTGCDPQSFLGALMTSAQLGLEPGPLGEAYLVPFGRQVTFVVGYRGLIKLAWQSGQVRTISAHVVREGDEFSFSYGLNPDLHHRPALRDRGVAVAAYAAATLTNGGSAFEVMALDEVERVRGRSRSSKAGPWVTDWEEMARKTPLRRLAKWLPLSTSLLQRAVQLDESTRTADQIAAPIDDTIPTYVVEPSGDQPAAAAAPPATKDPSP
jgi:recombination protein RecT